MTVTVRYDGPVTVVGIDRPEVRNAVDRATAEALAEAFRAFDADDRASVAVLYGEGGTFCSGADLKALGAGNGNRVAPDGDGPLGVTRMRLSKPVIAAVSGHAVAGGLEQDGLDERAAMVNEFAHGLVSLSADALEGAVRFSEGAGRHGAFENNS